MPDTRRQIHLGFTPEPFPEGTHICHLYSDDAVCRRFLRAYITSGLAEKELVENLPDVPASEDLGRIVEQLEIKQFADQGPGQLVIQPVLQSCCWDGQFDADRQLERIRGVYRRSQACGCAGARYSAEMTWALLGMPGTEQLVGYEARINNLVKEAPITIYCYYDTRKFDGKTLFEIMNVHPIIVVDGQIIHNPFYVPPEQFFAQENVALDKDGHTPSAVVLGRLLVIQQVLHTLPGEVRIGEFARHALMTVPGVSDAYVHITGHTRPPTPEMAKLCEQCEQAWKDAKALDFIQSNQVPGTRFYPLRSASHTFGGLLVRVENESPCQPYLHFLSNLANAIGLILETRLYQAQLSQAVVKLSQARDELELRVAERTRELQYLVTHDGLTGLPNRVLLIDRLENAIALAQRENRVVAVVYLALDRFTYFYTGMGPVRGDEFVKRMTQRLTAIAGEHDTVARVGFDQFVILLTDLQDAMHSSARLTKIRAAVRHPTHVAGQDVVVTCCVGVCFYPLDGNDYETLTGKAHAAMYRAQQAGNDSIRLFAEGRDSLVTQRMQCETELRQAIEGEGILVHYQPKLSLASRQFVGAEALARWLHPEKGIIMPEEFIPLAQESALIVALGEKVLLQACQQARTWQDAGLDGGAVAINVDAQQFRDRRIVEAVRRILRFTGLDPSRLELEITEGSVLVNMKEVIVQLREVREMGVSIAIDDFGTGYSSLSVLRQLPADKLKIDKSFVDEIETVSNAAAVVRAVIAVAKDLGMMVTAEGVETAGQARFLLQHGCDEIQGFLVARPLPAESAQELIRRPFTPSWSG